MRARRRTVLVALLGSVLVTAGCAGAPAEPAAPPNPFPPRPKNLDLSNVDLCSLLTPAQREERGIDRDESRLSRGGGIDAPTCNWTDDDALRSWSLQVFPNPAAVNLETPGSYVTQISGFGAVRGPNDNPSQEQGDAPFCQIPIDASDSRSLRVQYGSLSGDAGNPEEQEAACRTVIRFAEDILAALSRRPG